MTSSPRKFIVAVVCKCGRRLGLFLHRPAVARCEACGRVYGFRRDHRHRVQGRLLEAADVAPGGAWADTPGLRPAPTRCPRYIACGRCGRHFGKVMWGRLPAVFSCHACGAQTLFTGTKAEGAITAHVLASDVEIAQAWHVVRAAHPDKFPETTEPSHA